MTEPQKTGTQTAQAAQPPEVQALLNQRDVFRRVGFFCDPATLAALAQSCKGAYFALAATEDNVNRHAANIIDTQLIFNHHLSRGDLPEVKRMLDEAVQTGQLSELLTATMNISLSRHHQLEGVKPLPYALWALHKSMFNLIKEYMDTYLSANEATNQVSDFLRAGGGHVDLTTINQRWAAFNAFAAGIKNWKQFVTGSEQDLTLQALFQAVIEETAELPPHMLHEMLTPDFSAGDVYCSLVSANNVSFDALAQGSEFGKTYGLLRTQKEAVAVTAAEAADYAKRCVKYNDTVLSLPQINANGVEALGNERITWFTNIANQLHRPALARP